MMITRILHFPITKIMGQIMLLLTVMGLASCSATATPFIAATATITEPATQTPSPAPTPSPTSTQTPSPTPTNTASPTPAPTHAAGGAQIVFEGLFCENDICDGPAIYFHDFSSESSRILTGKGFSLVGISPDRKTVLAAESSNLYTVRISDGKMVLLADNLFDGKVFVPALNDAKDVADGMTAFWGSEDKIYFVGWSGERKYIFSIHPDGGDLNPLTPSGYSPTRIYPSYDGNGIYWASVSITAQGTKPNMMISGNYRFWWMSEDGSQLKESTYQFPVFSPDGKHVTLVRPFFPVIARLNDKVVVKEIDVGDSQSGVIVNSWSPDGTRVMVKVIEYCGLIDCTQEDRHFILNTNEEILVELHMPEDYDSNTRIFWVDETLLFFKTAGHIYLYDPDRDVLTDVTDQVWWSHFIRKLYVIRSPGQGEID